MTPTNKQRLKKFAVSLAWNVGGMVTAFSLDAIAKNIGFLGLPTEAVVFLGIVISRLTKVANVYFNEKIAENQI